MTADARSELVAARQRIIEHASSYVPSDPAVASCWELLVSGVELGWIDVSDLAELEAFLADGGDWGVQELLFASLGDQLRVSFLGDRRTCTTQLFVDALGPVVLSFRK